MADEIALMRALGALVHAPEARRTLLETAAALRAELGASAEAKSTQAAIPLALYGPALPAELKSSWVFVLRAHHDHPAERHPNSIQRMFALDSAGAMEVWEEGAWRHRPLAPGVDDPGLSIQAHAWHRPARLREVWGVVSFHSVAPDELIEEVGDPATNRTLTSRHYLGSA